jgi:hypothetical protein
LVSQVKPRSAVPEWTPEEIPEFVPQGYDSGSATDAQNQSSLAPNFDNYAQYSALQSMSGTPQPQITNPYLQDPTGGISGATYYQGSSSFTQPVRITMIVGNLHSN